MTAERPKSSALIVTGGAGFIGSEAVRFILNETNYDVVVIDKLTYAGRLENLETVRDNARFHFYKSDISDSKSVERIFYEHRPVGVLHLAAESHVDRSIDGPEAFVDTNIVGTFRLLQMARQYCETAHPQTFKFVHVSTDEVFGSLEMENAFFDEHSPYDPRSPYSASKAASDHLVRAFGHTYKIPVVITNCGNNYGPFQFPEKLVPVVILNAINEKPIPVYGEGTNVRDWIYVTDHVRGIISAFESGSAGQTYLFGGGTPTNNLTLVKEICTILDGLKPRHNHRSYAELIQFVRDRPGHDFRYAIDFTKTTRELQWSPKESLSTALKKTVGWYLGNLNWCDQVSDKSYLNRLGLQVSSVQDSQRTL